LLDHSVVLIRFPPVLAAEEYCDPGGEFRVDIRMPVGVACQNVAQTNIHGELRSVRMRMKVFEGSMGQRGPDGGVWYD
jgi:hypothetical protein